MKPLPTRTLTGLPVFPLPDYYLFPGTVTPLHIFETRYRQMMRDLMDSSGRLVMAPCAAATPPGHDGPALPPLGTLVEIVQTEELEDGRWLILLLALARVEMTEIPSDRLYRKVDAVVLPDPEVPAELASSLRPELVAALKTRTGNDWEPMDAEAPIGALADLLLHALALDDEQRRRAHTERDPVVRTHLALDWNVQCG